MSDAAPALMLLAWPEECPRCGVRHLTIPLSDDDHVTVKLSVLSEAVEAAVWDKMLEAMR